MAEHWHWQFEILERSQGYRREISWKMEGALAGCQLLAAQQHEQCVEEEFWKRVIECSQTRELVAIAARFLQCAFKAVVGKFLGRWKVH